MHSAPSTFLPTYKWHILPCSRWYRLTILLITPVRDKVILTPFVVPLVRGRCTKRRKKQRVEKVLVTGTTVLKSWEGPYCPRKCWSHMQIHKTAKDLSVYFMLVIGDLGFPLKEKVMTLHFWHVNTKSQLFFGCLFFLLQFYQIKKNNKKTSDDHKTFSCLQKCNLKQLNKYVFLNTAAGCIDYSGCCDKPKSNDQILRFPQAPRKFFNTFQLILNYTVALAFTCARQFGLQPQNFQQIQVINWSI